MLVRSENGLLHPPKPTTFHLSILDSFTRLGLGLRLRLRPKTRLLCSQSRNGARTLDSAGKETGKASTPGPAHRRDESHWTRMSCLS